MREFDVVALDRNSFLGEHRIAAGNTEQFRVRFNLERGQILASVTASSTSPVSTVQNATLSEDKRSLYFDVSANTVFEVFTVSLIVTDSFGQTLNYTIIYEVTGPVTQTLTPNPLPVIIGPTGSTGPTGPAGGVSATIVTAPISNGGNTGSMVFANGLLTSQTQAT
jgi:hypothetical protein